MSKAFLFCDYLKKKSHFSAYLFTGRHIRGCLFWNDTLKSNALTWPRHILWDEQASLLWKENKAFQTKQNSMWIF